MPQTPSGELTSRDLAAYGLASVPAQFSYVLMLIMYLKFAVDDLGASATAVGTIFLVAKLWDAVSDPLVGNLSDRTRSRLGRRKGWLYASGPLLALFGAMAWAPPATLEGTGLIAWIAVAIFGFYTAYTVFEVPHMALGAELTFERQQRNVVFGVRQVLRTLGMFAAGTLGVHWVGQGRGPAAMLGFVAAGIAFALVVGCVAALPRERAEFAGRGGHNPLHAVRDVFANRHARLLLFVFFIENLGSGAIGVLTPFVIEYVVKRPDLLPALLGGYMVSALVAVPLWVWLGRHFEKRRLWLFALVQGGVGYSLVFWSGEGDWHWIAACAVLAGVANACGNTLGQALKAEVIDYDELLTGERKEGAYFAGWSFMSKLAGGIMIGVVGVGLDWSGYVENAAEQTELAKDTMLWLMGGVPMVAFAIAVALFSRFELSEREHARIRRELDARGDAER
ncbi:MAG: MFS transporter [Myxococcota bacterium]